MKWNFVRQTRKTKEDQLRKKMQETQRSSSAREMMFALEKAKRERLEATMHHFEQHMHQRELTLAEKVCTMYFNIIVRLSPSRGEVLVLASAYRRQYAVSCVCFQGVRRAKLGMPPEVNL